MAIHGGATAAYICKLDGDKLSRTSMTTARSLCTDPIPAFYAILNGETVTVAGGDITSVVMLIDRELQRRKLAQFARDILSMRIDGIGSEDVEDAAVRLGLLVETETVTPCGKVCACAGFCGDGENVKCLRVAEWMK